MNYVSGWLGCLVAGAFMTATPALAGSILVADMPYQVAQQDESTQRIARHFQDLEIEGSILIYDLNRDRTYQHNRDRNTTPFLPASTFKILNSLVALETDVIANDLAILTWDGVERSIPTWNRDLNIRTAFQVSAVWFYQVLARRVGHERMQQWITETGYGNETIGRAEDIDTFWLTGDLRISPEEQIQFLQRLYHDDLPFSEETLALVKDIMIVEQTPAYTLRAKTGWASQPQIGWYVGYLEQNDNVYFFATNIDIRDQADLAARLEVTRRSLRSLQLL